MGIAGFPGSGKTTVFNALTGLHAEVGLGSAPRQAQPRHGQGARRARRRARGDLLAEEDDLRRDDVRRLPRRRARAARLDERVLTQMREADALAQVVRAFDDPAQPRAGSARAISRASRPSWSSPTSRSSRSASSGSQAEKGKEREGELLEQDPRGARGGASRCASSGCRARRSSALAGFQFLR